MDLDATRFPKGNGIENAQGRRTVTHKQMAAVMGDSPSLVVIGKLSDSPEGASVINETRPRTPGELDDPLPQNRYPLPEVAPPPGRADAGPDPRQIHPTQGRSAMEPCPLVQNAVREGQSLGEGVTVVGVGPDNTIGQGRSLWTTEGNGGVKSKEEHTGGKQKKPKEASTFSLRRMTLFVYKPIIRTQQGAPMEKKHRFSLWYVLIGMWLVLIVQSYIAAMFAVQTVPYSQFLNLLRNGKITEIAVTANQIQGKMKVDDGKTGDTKAFKTIRVDQELSTMLEKYPVIFKGEIESTFLRDLLSWVLPILLFIGVWYFLMKRMSGQQAGF